MTIRHLMMLAALAPVTATAQMTPLDSARIRAAAASAILQFEWNWQRPLGLEAGKAAGYFDSTFAPPNAKILGGISSILVLEMASAPAEALAAMRVHLLNRGLRLGQPNPRQGFVFGPATAESLDGLLTMCRDNAIVRVRTRPADTGSGSLVHLRYSAGGIGSPCGPPASGAFDDDDRPDSDLEKPLLLPPEGAVSSGGAFGGQGWSSTGEQHAIAEASVRSGLSTGEMMTHYAAQLRGVGWTVEAPVSNAMIGVLTARKTDSKGRPLLATLSDIRTQRGTHRLTMRIEIPPTRRR